MKKVHAIYGKSSKKIIYELFKSQKEQRGRIGKKAKSLGKKREKNSIKVIGYFYPHTQKNIIYVLHPPLIKWKGMGGKLLLKCNKNVLCDT